MTILVVAKSPFLREQMEDTIRKFKADAKILVFRDSPKALAAAREERIDVAFIDDKLSEIDGLLLGRYLKDLNPMVNLVILTKVRGIAYDAMGLRASGCILLPLGRKDVEVELGDLRFPPDQPVRKRVFAQTFGNFELFVDGTPVTFKYSRTKEIVALLINNRGVQTTNGEIIAALWEDDGDPKVKTSYLSNLRQDLQNTLSDLNLNDIIIKQLGSMAIATDKIECDFYDWMDKKNASRYRYLGDYMNQFSWAEMVHAELDELSYQLDE